MALASVRLDVAADRREAPAPVVHELSLRDVERWDRFVLEQPEAHLHVAEVRVAEAGVADVVRLLERARALEITAHRLGEVSRGVGVPGVRPLEQGPKAWRARASIAASMLRRWHASIPPPARRSTFRCRT